MTRPITQIIVALGLIASAVVSWNLAAGARARLSSEQQRLTLQENSDYWSGRYDLVPTAAGDAQAMLLAANAAFRTAQRDPAGPSIERLDQVLQAYASALKNGGFNHDAAYNFEYVSRLRDVLAKSPRRPRPTPPGSSAPPDDLPGGPTLHGEPGTHPPGTRGEEFEVITPMDYGEREAQPEPTPGRPFPRKG